MALLPNILEEGDIFLITCVDVKAMQVYAAILQCPGLLHSRSAEQGPPRSSPPRHRRANDSVIIASSPKCCFFEGRNARAKVPITYQNQVQTSGVSSMTSISEQWRLSSHIPIDWYQMKGHSPKERGLRRRLDNAWVLTWPCNTPEEQQDFALLAPSFSFADLIQFISHPCPYRAFTGNHAKYCVQ
ncbi:uncharacterized protein RAG0_11713 [Rhynchosporium agropyri]|uniref:Uncharacterized protein n=1 Tax=Rhynchosporium agropyri TaxID=914238 RepID=A0A1E1L5H2_9HELO|nr:uncharacterized protein RAG0_11713 [Rhynchosporium agropyri]